MLYLYDGIQGAGTALKTFFEAEVASALALVNVLSGETHEAEPRCIDQVLPILMIRAEGALLVLLKAAGQMP